MQFPNEVQSALLFDRPIKCLETVARTFMTIEEANTGARYNVSESNPGLFYRLYGGDDLMVTLEYIDRPANVEVFRQTLESAFTKISFPEAPARLAKHRSHILIGVSHGVLGSSPELQRLMATLDMASPGATLPQFRRRLDVCGLLTQVAHEAAGATAVHWTQSNLLLSAKQIEVLATMPPPSPLHVHPYLFGGGKSPDGKALVGMRTFGARHFIGGEVLIEPSALPWAANFETILAFLRVCLIENGYVIPDGDSFGPEDRSLSYRVHHRAAAAGDVPIYELEPLMYREFGFQADAYVPPERVFDDRSAPSELMPENAAARDNLLAE